MASNRKLLKMSDEIASCSSTIEEVTLKANLNSFTSDFGEIVKTNCFIDKTPLIRTIFHNSATRILVTTPRRFGKSTNMDMVKKFIEIQVDNDGVIVDRGNSPNRKIFQDNNLLIFQDHNFFDKHFATYPVIHVSFKPVTGKSFDEVLDQFRYVLHEAFEKHEYLLISDKLTSDEKEVFRTFSSAILYSKLTETNVETGLKFLAECLHQHFDNKKVFVLIDEYDAPINNTMFESDTNIDKVNKLLSMIFSTTLKDDECVERALLTGISYFATVGLSGTHNIEKCMFLTEHDFVPYYGVTEDELSKLFSKFKIDNETQIKVKLRYKGYVSLNGTKLYSIWSVLHFLQKKRIDNYWEDSGIMMNLREAMNRPLVRCSIETLCLEKSVEIEIFKNIEMREIIKLQKVCSKEANSEIEKLVKPDIYLNFFLQQGYLTFEKHVRDQLYTVRVPNAEILRPLRSKLLDHYGGSIYDCLKKCAVSFKKISTSSEDEMFKNFISKFNKVLDKFNNHYEDAYRCIMVLVLYNTKFSYNSQFSISNGRTVDLIM